MAQAEEFLHALDPTTDKFLFLTFGDKEKDQLLTRVLYGRFDLNEPTLRSLNAQGAGVFVTVNRTRGNRRLKSDVTHCRAVWQEDDATGDHVTPQLPPHIIVRTSEAHYHRYWLTDLPIESGDDALAWEKAQYRMVRLFGSDPNARDISRVMRVPGFYNHKRAVPELVELISVSTSPRYSWESIEGMTRAYVPAGMPEAPKCQATISTLLSQISSGEHIHGPIRTLMFVNANKGFDIEFNRATLQGLIRTCPDENKRAKALSDLEPMLKATYRKISAENDELTVPDVFPSPVSGTIELKWPPGRMGELAKAANDFFVLPNKTAAIMTSLSLIAGIVGRKYNVSSSGLNLYTTIMMPTGAGKDSIRKFCQRVLKGGPRLGTRGLSFLGPQNFTGPKALLTELMNKPSMISIMTEAGLLYKSDVGDRVGLTRVILQAYTSSGRNEFIEAERYSKTDESIKIVYAPALTVLNEATPATLLGELKSRGAIDTGELPRMFIFMLAGKKPYANPNPHQLSLPEDVETRIGDLILECSTAQNNQVPDVNQVAVPEAFRAYSDWCTDKYNEAAEEDQNKAIMYTRSAHKALKVAAILSVFNEAPVDEMFAWAKHLLEFEMANVEPIINGQNSMSEAFIKAKRSIWKILKGQYKSKGVQVKEYLRHEGIFTQSAFRTAVAGTPAIRDCGTSHKYGSPKSGAMVILEYMVREGYLTKVPRHGAGSTLYKITKQLVQEYKDPVV